MTGQQQGASRFLAVPLWLGLALLTPAFGQIGITMKLDRGEHHDKYLQYEPVWAEITLRNDTGNTLVFDATSAENRMGLDIETSEGVRLPQANKKFNPAANLILGAGESRTLKLMLNDLYNLNAVGSYKVTAKVGHARLPHVYYSDPPKALQVVKGSVVWTKTFGLPTADASAPIRSRQASILIFSDGRHDIYAVQTEDDKNVYGLVRLGPRFIGNKPQCDVDGFGNIHTLILIRPRLMEYRVFDGALKQKLHRYYAVESDMPSLRRDPDIGRISVSGGRPAVEGKDYQLADLKVEEIEIFRPAVTPPTATPADQPAPPAVDGGRITTPLDGQAPQETPGKGAAGSK